ncbi:MAG TPA: succinate dehydrogenase, hydrophobic membrane anchor protein [Methylocystis sp.]|nr:succinate dehydrogenase, hydrophobic membrane anchor protein [Methylocystis sp.]
MASRESFISGRTGRGPAHTSDRSGTTHDRFMRVTSLVLVPLGLIAAWLIADLAGANFEEARAQLAHPLSALALIAFIALGAAHARRGAESIIIDYVHDPALKEQALVVNKWAARAIAVVWTLAILLIAAPR